MIPYINTKQLWKQVLIGSTQKYMYFILPEIIILIFNHLLIEYMNFITVYLYVL